MLGIIAENAGPRIRGFLAHREAGDIWFLTQALVESSLMDRSDLAGCSADIEKAFESIPRRPLEMLCADLGLPHPLTLAWFRFLHNCQRRFQIHGEIGDSLASTAGLPEGCGISSWNDPFGCLF